MPDQKTAANPKTATKKSRSNDTTSKKDAPSSLKDVVSETNVEDKVMERLLKVEQQMELDRAAHQQLLSKQIVPQVEPIMIVEEEPESVNRDTVYNPRPGQKVNENKIRIGTGR